MSANKNKRVLISQPKDDSFESFKSMVQEMFTSLTGKKDDGSMTDDDWREMYNRMIGKDNPS